MTPFKIIWPNLSLCTQLTPFKAIWPDFCIVYPTDLFQGHLTQFYHCVPNWLFSRPYDQFLHCVPNWLLSRPYELIFVLSTQLTPFKTICPDIIIVHLVDFFQNHLKKGDEMVLKGVNWVHNAKIRSYCLERSQLGTQWYNWVKFGFLAENHGFVDFDSLAPPTTLEIRGFQPWNPQKKVGIMRFGPVIM